MSGGSETDATLPAEGGTLATSAPGDSEPRIRGSRPSLTGAADYPELRVVDPTHYALGREIARGGMGRIWVARDRRLGRDVALKEVLGAAPGVLRRFEREARITARLQHPSIVAVHEAGVWPSGEPFYAMRLVSGRSLDEVIASARGFDQRLAILPNVLAVADAMAYAHGQRVIHRDLKPRNVVVGEFGETVVIDWGLAKDLGDPAGGSLDGVPASGPPATGASAPGETTAGDVLGTPSYMPPEQAAGQPVDERADVYAIGAMLYHVLAGEPPYREPTSAEVIAAVMTAPPPPIRERAPAAPGELVAILERAMARDRAARYPTARELAEDLRRFQTGQLVGAHRYSLGQLARRWLRRHRTAIAAVAAAAIAAIVIGVVALRRIFAAERRVEQERAEAVTNRKSAEDLASFMMGDLQTKLGGVGRLDLLDAVAQRAAAYYDARGAAGDEDDRDGLGHARLILAKVLALRGDVPAARVQYQVAADLFAILAAMRPDVVKYGASGILARLALADLDAPQGRAAHMIPTLRALASEADQLVARQPGDADALFADCASHQQLAGELDQRGDPAGGLAESARGLEIAKALEQATPGAPKAELMLAQANLTAGDLARTASHDDDAALADYRAALAIADRETVKDSGNLTWLARAATAHRSIADILIERHDLTGARSELEAGLVAANRLHELDPSNAGRYFAVQQLHERIGMVLVAQHDIPGALAQYRICESVLKELMAREPANLERKRNLSVVEDKIGEMLGRMHRLDEALAIFQNELALRQELVAKDPGNAGWRRDLFYIQYLIGVTYSQMPGRMRDALASFRGALATASENAAQHPTSSRFQLDVAQIHGAVGEALAQLHDLRAARAEFHTALDQATREAAQPGADPTWKKVIADMHQELSDAGERPPR